MLNCSTKQSSDREGLECDRSISVVYASRPPGAPRGRFLRDLGIAAALAGALVALDAPRAGGEPQPPEYAVKAAFLYNFSRFVTWPEEAVSDTVFRIGVVGFDPFGPFLEQTFSGRSRPGRSFAIRRIQKLEEASACHVLFISSDHDPRLMEALRRLQNKPILTVGETEGFAQWGGAIRLFLDHKKVRFEVNLAAAQKAGLRIAPQMLQLAAKVYQKAG